MSGTPRSHPKDAHGTPGPHRLALETAGEPKGEQGCTRGDPSRFGIRLAGLWPPVIAGRAVPLRFLYDTAANRQSVSIDVLVSLLGEEPIDDPLAASATARALVRGHLENTPPIVRLESPACVGFNPVVVFTLDRPVSVSSMRVFVDEKNGTREWPAVVIRDQRGVEVRMHRPTVELAHRSAADARWILREEVDLG